MIDLKFIIRVLREDGSLLRRELWVVGVVTVGLGMVKELGRDIGVMEGDDGL